MQNVDPNYVKLYQLAQLTIEYLLVSVLLISDAWQYVFSKLHNRLVVCERSLWHQRWLTVFVLHLVFQ